jgi:hypothetical protein
LNGRAQSDVEAAARSSLISGNLPKIFAAGATKKVVFFGPAPGARNRPQQTKIPALLYRDGKSR